MGTQVSMARLVALFLLVSACVVAVPEVVDIDEATAAEKPGSLPTVRYLLRDETGQAAAKLHNSWEFQVKSSEERGDDLIETFGHHHHQFQLKSMGFTLLETEEKGGFSGEGYHNPKEFHEAFVALTKKYPKTAKIFDLTKEYSMPKTVEGRSLYAIKVSDNAEKDESEPNVLVVSNHHARELITPELALNIATRLLEGYDKAERMESGELGESDFEGEEMQEAIDSKKILDESQLYVQWTMNPDGLNTVWENDSWKRTNGRNVDLNRNYPIGWGLSCGGSTNSGGETWRGPPPFSEPETKTMRA